MIAFFNPLSEVPPTYTEKSEASNFLNNLYLEKQNLIINIEINDYTKNLINILSYIGYLFELETTFCSCMDLSKCKCTHGRKIDYMICHKFFIDYWKP